MNCDLWESSDGRSPVEEELTREFKRQPYSVSVVEKTIDNMKMFNFFELVQARTLVEIGSPNLNKLYVCHFSLWDTRGHFLLIVVTSYDLLLLHFYTDDQDVVPKTDQHIASERADQYWQSAKSI